MGRRWSGVLARLGMPTGDGRIIAPGNITSRDLPLPLMWQEQTDDGHGGSRVVGRIETIEMHADMITATGTMLDVAYAWDAEALLDAGVIGPSVDLDDVEYQVDETGELLVITSARIAGATLVPIPAFAEVNITLDPRPVDGPAEPSVATEPDLGWLAASAAPAAAAPPAQWFERPDVDRLTPLTVTDTGRVFGHIAPWGQCHVGLPGCVTAPSSPSGYKWFHLHGQALDDGTTLPVGVLTVGGGHADAKAGMIPAMAHYDNVGTAVAKVRAGEDEFGIWVAGWMLPQATEEQRQVFMSSPVSGDWRPSPEGALDLIAVCSVNTPGFPVPRARVAFSHQEGQRSLIASLGRPVAGELEPGVVELRLPSPKAADARARWAWFEAMGGV